MSILISITVSFTAVLLISLIVYRSMKKPYALKQANGLQGPVAARNSLIQPAWKRTSALAWAVTLLLISAVSLFFAWGLQRREIYEVRLLQKESVTAQASVTHKKISESDDGDTYYVTYAFSVVANDQTWDIEHRESVPKSLYQRVEYGGNIDIVYARSDPTIHRLQALYRPGRIAYWPLTIFGGLGLLASFFMLLSFIKYHQARRLDKKGLTKTVVLQNCYKSKDPDSEACYVAYQLPGVGPIRHNVEPRVYRNLRPGDTVQILQLPDKPKIFRPLW